MTKIYCLSDLHIGWRISNYPKIIEILDKVKRDADMLILCGDIFDLWRCPEEIILTVEPYKQAYNKLVEDVNESMNVLPLDKKIIYVSGNHDYLIHRWEKETGAPFIPFPVVRKWSMELNGYRYLFVHGWQFDTTVGPFMLLASMMPEIYYEFVSNFPWLYQKFWRHPGDIPRTEAAYSQKSEKIHRVADEFRKRMGYDYLVIGHTHDPGVYVYQRQDPDISNAVVDCGDMVDSLSYVIIEDGIPEVRWLER